MNTRESDISFEIVRKNIKHMYLRVYPPNGRVVVSAPRLMGSRQIDEFVTSRVAWIRKRQESISAQQVLDNSALATDQPLYLWGVRYTLQVSEGSRNKLELQGEVALLVLRKGSTDEQRERFMRSWFREQLKEQAAVLVPKWEDRTGLKCAEWKTKFMKSRWGTCNPKARRVWLNVELVHYPLECLEYVILHELVHLKDKTHGRGFKAELDKYMPHWQRVRKSLNARKLVSEDF